MENNKTTQQLFNDLTTKLIIPLDKPNEIVCQLVKDWDLSISKRIKKKES